MPPSKKSRKSEKLGSAAARSAALPVVTLAQGEADLAALPAERLERMAEAAAEVSYCLRVLAKTGDNVVGEVLRGHGTFYEWDHYPPGDVFDPETYAQYYYHAHPKEARSWSEHGHFHTFLRPEGMPPGMTPAPAPPPEEGGKEDALCHLIAISMDKMGLPVRLFTTNRWVTGETWYGAPDVILALDRFAIDLARPSWPANRWITAMVQLFWPQIADLLRARDRAVVHWQERHPRRNVYEDRALEILSAMSISLDRQLAAVERAAAGR